MRPSLTWALPSSNFPKCIVTTLLALACLVTESAEGHPITDAKLARTSESFEPRHLTDGYLTGITLDSISDLSDSLRAIRRLPAKLTIRVVFDEFVPPHTYTRAINKLRRASVVMGELLDSSAMAQYSVGAFQQRTDQYMKSLPVDIWEIGNEINGEWLGDNAIGKAAYAFEKAWAMGKPTALTLYYNSNRCWDNPKNEMFRWSRRNIPLRMRSRLTYLLVSYYEDDCGNKILSRRRWNQIFRRLSRLFPNSLLGIGEIGTKMGERKADLLRRYYRLRLPLPQFIGGFFYWYAKDDFVPYTKPLWSTFAQILAR